MVDIEKQKTYMCNCKKNVINNTDNRIILAEARKANDLIKSKSVSDITDGEWLYLYDVYNQAYPRSNGQPTQEELIKIIDNLSQLKTAYR